MSDPFTEETPTGGWSDPAQIDWYVRRIGKLEARRAGEQMLVDVLPTEPRRLVDLGGGDGRLTALALEARPSIQQAVIVDRSAPMLALAEQRFGGDPRVRIMEWDLAASIEPLGRLIYSCQGSRSTTSSTLANACCSLRSCAKRIPLPCS